MATRRSSAGPRRLRPRELRWTCPAAWIPKAAKRRTGQDPVSNLIGQERPLESLRMGLAVHAPGYNVFLSGIGGAERFKTVTKILDKVRLECPLLRDHVFLHNFLDPVRPRHLALAAGQGAKLVEGMRDWRRAMKREIPRLLESEEHQERRQQFFQRYATAETQLFRRLARRARSAGLALVQVEEEGSVRPDIYLMVGEKAVAPDALGQLPEEERPNETELRRLMMAREGLQAQLRKARHQARLLGLRLLREVQNLDEGRVREVVQGLTIAAAEEIGADEELAAWLGDGAAFALANLHLFRRQAPGEDPAASEDEDENGGSNKPGLEVYEVNLVRSAEEGRCPIVTELHPNYSNLFGAVERRLLSSGAGYFHLAVRPGSLLAADGGLLVLSARDVFKEAEVWRSLKRTLQNHHLEIHSIEGMSPLGVTGVRPEPIPIDLKVVLVGDNDLYEVLHDSDFDFPRIFKVKAEFDDNLPLDQANVVRLVRVLRELGEREGLLPFADTGLRALVERAVEDAGRQTRLSARVPALADYAREASYWARKGGKRRIDRAAVDEARRQFRLQHAADPEWFLRSVLDGVYEIQTAGERVGSVNALTVVSIGPLPFGRVARVSASVALGEDSTLNIEREVDLSGPIHTKGVLLLESFMRHRFGQKRTLPFKAALSFDQSYGPIDGDSASSTEVYALLSALSGLPVRQDLAVTGAVSMKGEVLAVGGVNQKVSGFYELCKRRGLTGEQGVLLPESNVADLMLDEEILQAVRQGRFHLWGVRSVDQGISLLTGVPAGARRKDGSWPPDSVMGRAEAAFERFEKQREDKDKAKD
jgi:predicted ATP-dependent protease